MTRSREMEAHFSGLWTAQCARKAERFKSAADFVEAIPTLTDSVVRTRTRKMPLPLEKDVQSAALELLSVHPRVAFVWRQNVGGMVDDKGHHVRFAFPGCSDIIGMLKDGRFLAIEMKRPGGKGATPDQQAFLLRVARNNGVSFVARDVDDVMNGLAAA